MTRIISAVLAMCLLILPGCSGGVTDGDFTDGICEFEAQYIRTNGYTEGAKYPEVTVIRSKAELDAYYQANCELYSLERRDKVYSDTTIGFLDACDRYTDEYFRDSILLLILIEEGSGSVRHNVESVEMSGGKMEIKVKRTVPEVCTDDMAEWHIMIELDAGVSIKIPDDITVILD